MSDTRRRRKSHNSGGSEDLSDSYDELNVTKETQNNEVTEVEEHHDSEYETGESGSEADSQEGGLRESGDGQEEDKPQRKLDDDEDRRNPQYIPKRGTFYEHDDRTTEEVAEEKVETPNEREAKEKKVWKDKEDRWDHDRYNDDEQAPKSHDELVAVYGYDIRNEEGPPRARRRRRYGRGPNKYTRNWEDEDAYGKPGGPPSVGRGGTRKTNRSGEEFPALSGGNNKDDGSTTPEEPVISSAWYSNKNKSQPKAGNFPPLQPQHESPNSKPVPTNNSAPVNENKTPNEPTNPAWKKELTQNSHSQSPNRSGGGGDADKLMNHKSSPRDSNKRQVQESVSLAASRARGRGFKASGNTNNAGSNRLDYKAKGRGSGSVLLDNRRNNADNNHIDDHHLINDMKQMNVNDGGSFQQSNRQNSQVRPGTIPPRIQQQHQQPQQQQQLPQQQSARQQQHDAAGNRPKRYSSLRQRPPVPEGPGQQGYQPQHGQHGYYPQAGNSRGVLDSQGYPPGHFEQAPPVATPAAPLAGQPVLPLPPGGQPASFAPPPFLVPSPQFLPPQGAPPSMINYVQGPNGPAFQPNFQGYQGFSPPVQPQGPPPPQELFQPQGCTYYSPAQQQQHAVPMRRPKAAIPILPPPDNQQHMTSRGRGRTTQQQSLPVPGGGMQRTNTEGKNNLAEGDGKFIQAQCAGNQIEKQIPTDHFAVNDTTEVGANCADNEDKDVISNSEMTNISETPNELKISLDVVVMKEQQQENEQEQEQQQEQEQPQEQQRVSESDDVITNKAAEQVTVNTTEPELPKIENKVIESPVVEEAAA
ncbi:trithorax group protein osa-like isoform X2 [Diprion similis]|uniref:trithorax group protein osa-like isoform X2 n=1 Tax=Diprion similis TaxID=362088 RepID=UPI001EF8B761|nr:trithorax group protein osa-like isoform X2 [Diprion similis]